MRRRLAFAGLLILSGCSGRPHDALEAAAKALAEHRDQDAWELAGEALAAGADSVEALLVRARAALRTMRTTPGVTAAARAVELAPRDPRARHVQALLEQRRLRNLAAIRAEQEAVRLAPREVRYRIALGELFFGGGRVGTPHFEAAEEQFREALRLSPGNLRALLGLGKSLVLAGRHEEGARALERFLAECPFHPEACYLRGVVRMRSRDFQGAEEDFSLACLLNPSASGPYFNRARVLRLLGRDAEAQEVLERYRGVRALEMEVKKCESAYHEESGNVRAALEFERALAGAGRFEEALALLESLSIDEPSLPAPQLALARVALEAGLLERAAAAAARAVELSPANARARHLAARIGWFRGEPEAALAHARRAVELDPDRLEYRFMLGRLLLETEHFGQAARLFQEICERAPRSPRAAAGLGRALAGAGRPAEGEAALSAALRVRPSNAEWLYHRALARAAQGKVGPAREDLRSAIDMAPDYTAPYEALARLLREGGDEEAAREMDARRETLVRRDEELRDAIRRFLRSPWDKEAGLRAAGLLEEAGRRPEALRVRGRLSRFEVGA